VESRTVMRGGSGHRVCRGDWRPVTVANRAPRVRVPAPRRDQAVDGHLRRHRSSSHAVMQIVAHRRKLRNARVVPCRSLS